MIVDIILEGNVNTDLAETLTATINDRLNQLAEWYDVDATEISVMLTDNDTIAKLNLEWRGKDAPTDVLSFPGIDYSETLMDIQIQSPEEMNEYLSHWDEQEETDENDSVDTDESEDQEEIPLSLGDIVISLEYASDVVKKRMHVERLQSVIDEQLEKKEIDLTFADVSQKLLEEWTLKDEVEFLLLHSFLHLLGWDHETEDEDYEMRHEEFILWRKFKNI